MRLLGTDAFRNSLAKSLTAAGESVDVLSAYVTEEGIEWMLSFLKTEVRLRVVVRWTCSDLLSGASDVAVYPRLRSRGAELFVLRDLHAKLMLIDRSSLFVGSANITSNGLKLVPGGNRELCVETEADDDQIQIVESLLKDSTRMTDELYASIVDELSKYVPVEGVVPQWSIALERALSRAPNHLWVSEMMWSPSPQHMREHPTNENSRHDRLVLGIDSDEKECVEKAFTTSRCWQWLVETLRQSTDKTMYFGELSQQLHSSLIDDPTPYRQEVKGLLANLLSFVEVYGTGTIHIDRPNYSQRIRLSE
jgi:hypothetical protein